MFDDIKRCPMSRRVCTRLLQHGFANMSPSRGFRWSLRATRRSVARTRNLTIYCIWRRLWLRCWSPAIRKLQNILQRPIETRGVLHNPPAATIHALVKRHSFNVSTSYDCSASFPLSRKRLHTCAFMFSKWLNFPDKQHTRSSIFNPGRKRVQHNFFCLVSRSTGSPEWQQDTGRGRWSPGCVPAGGWAARWVTCASHASRPPGTRPGVRRRPPAGSHPE